MVGDTGIEPVTSSV